MTHKPLIPINYLTLLITSLYLFFVCIFLNYILGIERITQQLTNWWNVSGPKAFLMKRVISVSEGYRETWHDFGLQWESVMVRYSKSGCQNVLRSGPFQLPVSYPISVQPGRVNIG